MHQALGRRPHIYKGCATGSFLHGLVVVLFALVISLMTSASAQAVGPTPVTTRELDTGANSEKVASLPISSGEPSPTNVYSLKAPTVHSEEVLRATGDVEISASRTYPTTVSIRLALTEGETETAGTAVTPWTSTILATGQNRLTLPIDGTYQAPSALGTRYLQLEVKASSAEAKSGDTLAVTSNSGRLAVTRYAPTPGPTSLDTRELQPLIGGVSEQVTSVPVDSEWRVVLSRKIADLGEEDLLDTVAQLGVENTSGTAVKLESRVLRTSSATSTGGTEMATSSAERLSAATKFARIATSNETGISSNPTNNYVNLSVRAVSLEGSPKPLTVVAGSGALNMMRMKPSPGKPESPLLEGTLEQNPAPWTGSPKATKVPFATEGKESVVVHSLPIFGLTKGQVIRARSSFTADLTGKEAVPVETAIVIANSESATSGEIVAPRSGDTVPGGGIHTITKDATYIAPATSEEVKYLNLVVYANRAPKETGESLSAKNGASLNYSRSEPVGQPPQATPVTTRELDTGPSSEKVSTLPIASGSPSPSVVYSLKVPTIHNGEVLRATGDLELTGNHTYATTVQARLVLASGASETSGTVVTSWSAVTKVSGSNRLTLPIDGSYQAPSELGTRYLQLEVQASSGEAKSGDTLVVTSNSGRLGLTRYAPTPGPTSLPTHELQPLLGELSEQVTSVPVDSEWRVVLSRKITDLTEEDLLDTVAQLGIENPNGAGTAEKLEFRVLWTSSATGTGGTEMTTYGVERLGASTKYARFSANNETIIESNPANNYVNLSVRAVPLEGSSLKPLSVVTGSGSLNIMRWKPNPGDSKNPPLEGTLEQSPSPWTGPPAVESVPFSAEGKEPRVVQSLPIFGLTKGQVIRARSSFTADLTGKEAVPVETAIVIANSAGATSGEVVAARSGDTVAGGAVHTITKDTTYLVPSTIEEVKYLNLVVYANRAPKESGEGLSLENSTASLNYSRSKSVGQSPQPTPVTTRELDTGPSSEQLSSVAISTGEPSPSVIYSLKVPVVHKEEVLRATGDVEVTANRSYPTTVSTRLALVEGTSETAGTAVTPWSATTLSSGSTRLTLPVDGTYQAPSELGTRYLKLEVKASSPEAKAGDTLAITPNSGRLALTRYAPTPGPTSVPTHELQPLVGELSPQITSLPVDSEWRTVLSRKVSDLAEEDLIDIADQVQVENPSGAPVKLESRILRATSATTAGGVENATSPTSERLGTGTKYARIVGSNEAGPFTNAGANYVNLSLRAVPVEGAHEPLKIVAGSGSLNILRFKPNPGSSSNPLLEGTAEQSPVPWNGAPELSSIPFAAEGKEPRVVQSIPIFTPIKGQVVRAHSTVTANLTGKEAAPVETAIVLANSKGATSGEEVGPRSGDLVSAGGIHTLYKSATYAVPAVSEETKYLNLVVYANRAPKEAGEAMSLDRAEFSLPRSKPVGPYNDGFEEGINAGRKEYNGTLSTSTAVAREGTHSMRIDVDPTVDNFPFDNKGIRRVALEPPEVRGAGGHFGEDTWHGVSVYFPQGFKVPKPDPTVFFKGKIDEVRLYSQKLSEEQIKTDERGEYTKTGTNPIAAYSFLGSPEEVESGIALDSTGHHDGVLHGVSWTKEGKYGSALEFDGSDEVRIPDAEDLDLTNAFTVEAWVDPEEVDAFTGTPVISKLDEPYGSMSGYLLRAAAVSAKASGLVANSGSLKSASGNALPIKAWSHLAMTSDGTTLRLYINGALVKAEPAAKAAPTSSDLSIGSSNYNTADQGTWNDFAYFHATSESRAEIGCPENFNGVPFTLTVRYFKAGAHTLSGEIKTSGDYIEAMIEGGEISADCSHSVRPEEDFAIAPLERNKWYDFVLHTRWTTELGSPVHPTSELWMNGKQVLGGESIPVPQPTITWRGTPETHNNDDYEGLGLYRGPSQEDPHTELYFDAVRNGNSYTQVAPK
jgi:hypothetical protein